MKVIKGNYIKEDGQRLIEVYVLKDTQTFIEGIDLTKLSEGDKIKMKEIVEKYYIELAPFIKAGFRRFNKVNINNPVEVVL